MSLTLTAKHALAFLDDAGITYFASGNDQGDVSIHLTHDQLDKLAEVVDKGAGHVCPEFGEDILIEASTEAFGEGRAKGRAEALDEIRALGGVA